jgi:hypothetical protein
LLGSHGHGLSPTCFWGPFQNGFWGNRPVRWLLCHRDTNQMIHKAASREPLITVILY